MAFNGSQQMQNWWAVTRRSYSVRANVSVSGEDYKKFGTEFDTRLLVIDKPLEGESPINEEAVTGRVEHVSELPELLEGVRNARSLMEQTPAESQSQGNVGSTPGARVGVPGGPVSTSTGGVGVSEPSGLPADGTETPDVDATPTCLLYTSPSPRDS